MGNDHGSPHELPLVLSVAFGAALLWQLYMLSTAHRAAAPLELLLERLGNKPPAITRAFLSCQGLFVALPVATSIAAIYVARARRFSGWAGAVVLALTMGVTVTFHAWTNEALFAPLLTIMRAIGP